MTPMAERDAAINGLATGKVQILCAADLISEGLDIPAISVVILQRPTKSLGLYLQQIGRGLRPAPGKSVLTVLDHAGNCLRHGMPEADREWSLDGRKKRTKQTVAVRQCPGCFAMHAPAPACPSCGHAYAAAPEPKVELEVREGSLQEIDGSRFETIRKAKLHELLKTAKTEEQLQEIAKAKGYKRGWIQHILAARGQRQGAAA
jgi:superfamily II DNA or RNA helicase